MVSDSTSAASDIHVEEYVEDACENENKGNNNKESQEEFVSSVRNHKFYIFRLTWN